MPMLKGVIIKGYSGFYYVQTEQGLVECSLRGKHKLSKTSFLAGDKVQILLESKNNKLVGSIESVEKRTTELLRPQIANVSLLVIVVAASNPPVDLQLLDRLTVLAEFAGVKPFLAVNKADDRLTRATELVEIYEKAGFKALATDAITGKGITELKKALAAEITVFAGQSGVGKSSLLNQILDDNIMPIGILSEKSQRGRHTTRHTELFALKSGGFIADTPGFSRLDFPLGITKYNLRDCFPEFLELSYECRFGSCIHRSEPECAVKNAVSLGEIGQARYDNYCYFLAELEKYGRNYNG